jgi:hypothetical protein
MDVGVIRDYVIVIGGLLLLVLILAAAIMGFLLYRQVKKLTNSIRDTVKLTREMSSEVKQAIKNSKDLIGVFKGKEEKKPSQPPVGSPN